MEYPNSTNHSDLIKHSEFLAISGGLPYQWLLAFGQYPALLERIQQRKLTRLVFPCWLNQTGKRAVHHEVYDLIIAARDLREDKTTTASLNDNKLDIIGYHLDPIHVFPFCFVSDEFAILQVDFGFGTIDFAYFYEKDDIGSFIYDNIRLKLDAITIDDENYFDLLATEVVDE